MSIKILNLTRDIVANLVSLIIYSLRIYYKFIKKNLIHHKSKNNRKKNYLIMITMKNSIMILEVGLCLLSTGVSEKNNCK